jgi:hypothetical protein
LTGDTGRLQPGTEQAVDPIQLALRFEKPAVDPGWIALGRIPVLKIQLSALQVLPDRSPVLPHLQALLLLLQLISIGLQPLLVGGVQRPLGRRIEIGPVRTRAVEPLARASR